MDPKKAIEYLRQLPVEELVGILQAVFKDRHPAPEEDSFCRNRFFLGTAWSELESDEAKPHHWGPWDVDAVAYPDPCEYGASIGPNFGLCQSGTCTGCGIAVRSNVKHGLCPICGTAVHMT